MSLAAASRAKGALACAGAARGRRATLVACVRRPYGTSGLTGSPIQAFAIFADITTPSVTPAQAGVYASPLVLSRPDHRVS